MPRKVMKPSPQMASQRPLGDKARIYMDANATTPLLPAVREAMAPWIEDHCANASSGHSDGRAARAAIENAPTGRELH